MPRLAPFSWQISPLLIFCFLFQAGYEAGSRHSPLPAEFINDLDNQLVPVVHGQSGSRAAFELVFHLLDVWTNYSEKDQTIYFRILHIIIRVSVGPIFRYLYFILLNFQDKCIFYNKEILLDSQKNHVLKNESSYFLFLIDIWPFNKLLGVAMFCSQNASVTVCNFFTRKSYKTFQTIGL